MLGSAEWAGFTDYLRSTSQEDARALLVALARADGLVIDFSRDGLRWRTDVGDEIGGQLYRTGSYERDEIAAVLRWLDGKAGVVVDAGANVGTTSIPFAQAGYRVVAIEPVAETFEMLSVNVSRNGFSGHVTCVRQAVSEQAGTLEMWTGTGSGQAEVVVAGAPPALLRWGATGQRVVVPAGPLNALLDELTIEPSEVALVWADVQGAETSVIRTGTELWAAGVPLYLEVFPAGLDLHAGINEFIAAVRGHFAGFIPRDDLIAGRAATAIEQFSEWVQTIDSDSYSDALLVHK
jgi:FkbM family methyltransferase